MIVRLSISPFLGQRGVSGAEYVSLMAFNPISGSQDLLAADFSSMAPSFIHSVKSFRTNINRRFHKWKEKACEKALALQAFDEEAELFDDMTMSTQVVSLWLANTVLTRLDRVRIFLEAVESHCEVRPLDRATSGESARHIYNHWMNVAQEFNRRRNPSVFLTQVIGEWEWPCLRAEKFEAKFHISMILLACILAG